MKKLALVSVLCFGIALSALFSQTNSIKVISTGKVGINQANPAYQLDISGTVRMAPPGVILFCSPALHFIQMQEALIWALQVITGTGCMQPRLFSPTSRLSCRMRSSSQISPVSHR